MLSLQPFMTILTSSVKRDEKEKYVRLIIHSLTETYSNYSMWSLPQLW